MDDVKTEWTLSRVTAKPVLLENVVRQVNIYRLLNLEEIWFYILGE